MKQSHILLAIIIFPILTVCLPSPPNPEQCLNYYYASSLPSQCSNSICTFSSGIFSLLVNTTNDDNLQFSLCIYLPQYNIKIYSNQTDDFTIISGSIFIQGSQIAIGYEQMGYVLKSENQVAIQANSSLSLISTQMTVPSIWLQTITNINIQNTTLEYEQSIQSICKCFVQESNCTNEQWKDIFPKLYSTKTDSFNMQLFDNVTYSNFLMNSVIIASKQNIILTNSSIKNSIIAIYTMQFQSSNSSLWTLGLGYASDSGLGCGYFDHLLNNLLGCTGSGGSHGGTGGNSSPNNCNLVMSRVPYGQAKFPTTPGSGGGYYFWQSKQASSGGGIVNIQVLNFISNQLQINANGGAGIQDGGGGSGGSISIDFSFMSGSITIQANGGDGKSSGGGGRVRYWNHNWQNYSTYSNLLLNLQASSGGQCTGLGCGSNGSIYISPCPRGYQVSSTNYLCQQCPLGTFQEKYGYSICIDCSSLIPNSQYVASNLIGYDANCNIVCNEGFTLVDNQCLDSFYFVISHIGGLNVLIALSIIVVVIILYLLIVMIRKLTEKDVFWNYGEKMNSYSSAKYFHIEQIPFHVMRLYLSGTNTQFDPWKISKNCQQKLYQKLGQPYTRAIPFLKIIFGQINKVSKYSKFQILLIILLKIYYYPLSRILSDKFKSAKCNKIFKKVTRMNSKIPEFQRLGIKFSVKPYYSIGSIQILDYSKSVYDFYIENYFPMVFLLQQYPLGDYTIDFTDPFIKAFINELSRREQTTKNLSKYIVHLSQLLKQKKNTMAILNHLWNINQYETRLQAYLWQPPNRILGVDKEFVIDPKAELFLIFNNQKKNQSEHFIHEQNIPNIHFGEVETLKHRMDYLRKQTIVTQRKYPIWEIKNHFNEKLLTWIIGIVSILLLLSSVFSFFMVIFILSQHQIKFNYGVSIYFILFPFIDFILSFINLRMILAKSQKMLSYGMFFSIGIIVKFLILSICAVIEISEGTNTFLEIVQGIWLAQFFLGIISLYLSMLINPHIARSNRKD